MAQIAYDALAGCIPGPFPSDFANCWLSKAVRLSQFLVLNPTISKSCTF